MTAVPAGVRIYLACGATAMRRGFDGLSMQAQEVLKQDPFSGAIFASVGLESHLVKILYWDGQGFLPAREDTGEGPLHLAEHQGRCGHADAGADVDAARRSGVAGAAAYLATDAGGIICALRRHTSLPRAARSR